MNGKLTRRQLICSLACPAVCFLWGSLYIVVYLANGSLFTNQPLADCGYFASIVLGGIVPALITVIGKVDTESYLKQRGFIILVVFAAFRAMTIGAMKPIHFYLYIAIGLAAILYQILHVQDELTTHSERAVLILSDPVIYWTFNWAVTLWRVAFESE